MCATKREKVHLSSDGSGKAVNQVDIPASSSSEAKPSNIHIDILCITISFFFPLLCVNLGILKCASFPLQKSRTWTCLNPIHIEHWCANQSIGVLTNALVYQPKVIFNEHWNANQFTASSVIFEPLASSFSLTHTASSSPNLWKSFLNSIPTNPNSHQSKKNRHLASDTPMACTSEIAGWPCRNSSISL